MGEALLLATGLHAGYGRTTVLHGVDLEVQAGEVVTLIGANGAGKSTLLKAVIGAVDVSAGSVVYSGAEVTGRAPERLVREGIALVPEGRLLFGSMSVRENLELGAYVVRQRARALKEGLYRVHELFPVLEARSAQRAATLSGGEQQMLAIGRALMSSPRLLLLDEPSLGLGPKVIAEIFEALDVLKADGVTILLVEQDARLALRHADRGYVMSTGTIVMSGPADVLAADERVSRIYLGGGVDERASAERSSARQDG